MASSSNSIFITNVEGFGDVLKIWGQRNRTCATYIEKQLMQLLPEFSRMPPPPANRIDKGIICFAKRSDGKYYRARVISDVYNKSVMVFFIDYGHRGTVDLSNIRLRNEATDGVISAIVPQAEEFFLANVASRGGWFEEVLNEVRRELCYKEYCYKFDPNSNQKFIYVLYHNEDYSNTLLRRNLATHVQVVDQVLFLKYRCKPQEQMGNRYMPVPNPVMPQQGPQPMPKLPPEHVQPQSHIPVNPVPSQMGFPNNTNQNAVFNGNNNNTNNNNNVQNDSKVTQVLNSVMIEALADQLKQHLLKETVTPTPDTTSHNYVTQVLEVGTTHSIYVSYIDDGPWSFSIQVVSSEHELNQLMDDLAACDLIPIKLPVVLGYPCIAKSKEYDNYCRGVVVNISHSAVKIFFVDFGNTEDLPVSSIFELPVRFFKVKAMSQKFALSGLQKIKPSPEIKKAFVDVVQNELLLLHVTTLEGENLPTCDLFLKNVNIKKILNEKVLQIRKWSPLQPPRQGELEDVVVTWIDSPQKFYVQLKKYDRELEELKMELAQWGANGEFFNPDELVPGALCVCCFTADNEWYRAIVTSINSKNSVTVFYVDFGNTEEVRPSSIKKIGNGLIRQLNAQAIQCCLHGFENKPVDSDAKTSLESLILEKELQLKVIYTDKDRIVVKLFDDDNDISLSLAENRTTSNSHPKYAASEKERKDAKEETGRSIREKTDAGARRNDTRNKVPSMHIKPEEKSWRKKAERSPRSDGSSEGGWRSDDNRRDGKGKDDAREKSARYGFRPVRKEAGFEPEKNWRNRENVEMRNEKRFERGQGKPKPAESIMERGRRAAKEAHDRGMKIHDINDSKYPVKLEDIALHGATFKRKHIPVGSVEEVIVTYFLNPSEIYVQLLSTKEDFRKVMDEIQSYYATKLPVANFPKKDDVVVAKFKGDEVLYRALVMDSNPLSVRYVDYGNEEVTEKERVWPMNKKFLQLEAQAIKCSLPNLIPNGANTWPVPEAQIDKIFEFETYSCKFLSCVDDVYEVSLTISENGKDVRDELISTGFALPAENKTAPKEGVKQCPSMDLTLMRNETYRGNVSHVVDPSEFYIQVDRNTLLDMESKLKYCQNEEVAQKSTPNLDSSYVSEGGLYLWKAVDGDWRRVKVLTKAENGAFVQLIDYGDKLDVAYEQMRTVPNGVLKYPPQAVQCCLFCDTEEYPSGVAESFKGCNRNDYIAYVHDVLENRLRVTLYNTKGEKLEFLTDVNDAPDVVRPITSLPITTQGMTVDVPYVTSPKEIYIQRMVDVKTLLDLKVEMLDFYENGGEDLEAGSKICAVKMIADECWYRARVLMSGEDHCKVFYIDYGLTEDVPRKNVKKLSPQFEAMHAFCRKISLNVDYDAQAESELSDKLSRETMDKAYVAYFAKVDDVMYGELIRDGGAVSDRLLSDKVKRVRNGMFRDVSIAKKVEEAKASGVFISHIGSPSEFWVHHESISNELEEFQNKLQSVCVNASPKEDIRIGDIVGALFADQLWYRSKVVALEDNVPTVQFIDYGNSLKIEDSAVVELTEDLMKAPPFAIFCSLKGEWKNTAASRFEEIVTSNLDPFVFVELEDGNPRIVDLVENGSSVTDRLISEGYDAANKDETDDDDDVYITHINSPNDFYIQRDSDKSLFDTLISGLLEADLFEDVEDIKENEMYCAKFPENEMWYRAKVLKKSPNGAYVHFIDYGNNCSVTEIKLLPSEFSSIPSLSVNCSLLYGESNDTWSEAACKKFMEYVNDSPLRMEIVLSGAQRSVVKLFTENGESVTEILEKLCEKDGREFVCITHVNSPNDFYVQRTDNKKFDVIDERLKTAEAFEVLEKKEVGMICCAKFYDDIWYRVKLKSIGDDGCDVFFIDYGNNWKATELRSLPEDIKEIEPLAKNCSLDFRVANIPESIKEEFIRLTEENAMLRAKIIQPGDRDIVSLIHDGMKLEEVLLYSILETSEIYNIQLDVETQGKTEIDDKSSCDELERVDDGYEGGSLEDDVRAGNETDEEKRVKFAIITSENTEGFRSDDEKEIMEGYALNSSVVNVPDHELLEGTEVEAEGEGVNGEETEEAVAVKSETGLKETPGGDNETADASVEDGSTNTLKYYKETGSRGETENTKEEVAADEETSSPEDEPCQKVHLECSEPKEGAPRQKVSFDDKMVSAAVNGTTDDSTD